MIYLTAALQWLHIFCGIFWFGSSLFAYFILYPALATLPADKSLDASAAIGIRTTKAIGLAAGSAILLGIIRGTFLGPGQSFDVPKSTSYGLTWLASLVLGVALAAFGARVLGPLAAGLSADSPRALRQERAARLRTLATYELVGFIAIFTCMILMRFGW
jgi:uncharacterized membrane protein